MGVRGKRGTWGDRKGAIRCTLWLGKGAIRFAL
jgi:hypothetical protein